MSSSIDLYESWSSSRPPWMKRTTTRVKRYSILEKSVETHKYSTSMSAIGSPCSSNRGRVRCHFHTKRCCRNSYELRQWRWRLGIPLTNQHPWFNGNTTNRNIIIITTYRTLNVRHNPRETTKYDKEVEGRSDRYCEQYRNTLQPDHVRPRNLSGLVSYSILDGYTRHEQGRKPTSLYLLRTNFWRRYHYHRASIWRWSRSRRSIRRRAVCLGWRAAPKSSLRKRYITTRFWGIL